MSKVTKPRSASSTPQAAQQKPKATSRCRVASREETRAWLGAGIIVPVPRPQAPPAKKATQPASAEPKSSAKEQGR